MTQAVNGTTTNYVYDDANLMSIVNGVTYTWDSNGNLINDGINVYDYDAANPQGGRRRLTNLTDGTSTSSYTYNGQGDRLSQTVDGVTTEYTLDLNTGLIQVLTDGTNTYLYGLSRLGQESTTTEYFLGDAPRSCEASVASPEYYPRKGIGAGDTIRQLADDSGNITLTKSYTPFGEVLSESGTGESIYGYTGEVTDESGLVYLRARYYGPLSGRFITKDTWLGEDNNPISYNLWIYAYDNSVLLSDPSGHFGCKIGWPNFCILNKGGFIDESHYGTSGNSGHEAQTRFYETLTWVVGKGPREVKITHSAMGLPYSGIYTVNIPKSSEDDLPGIAVGIWLDYENNFEQWEYENTAFIRHMDLPNMGCREFHLGAHSVFETADIPSTYLGLIATIYNKSYETIVEDLGGGYSWPFAPIDHIVNIISLEEYKQCISTGCAETSSRNSNIFFKVQDESGSYSVLPYVGNDYIGPSNNWNSYVSEYRVEL